MLDENKPISEISTYSSGVIQARVHRNLKKVTTKILKKHNLTMNQWFILGTIFDSGENGIRITELAERVDTSLPYLTKTINILESRKMVVRKNDANDNRSKLVAVTPQMAINVPKIEEAVRIDMRKIIYPTLTPEELEEYIHTLYKLSKV